MKRVLVTGGSGFIGRQVWGPLQHLGYEIHAVGRRRPKELPPGAEFHEIDLLDCSTHLPLVGRVRPTHLLHLAWYAEHGKYWNAPENLQWLEVTQSLVGACTTVDSRRFVVAGTCAEYDWRDGLLVESQTPESPASLYGETKLAAFRKCCEVVTASGASIAWGRIFFPYGPEEFPRRLVPYVISQLLRGEPVHCLHSSQIRDFIYSLDVAGALVALLHSTVNGPVNIGSGNPITIGELALTIAVAIGRRDLLILDDVEEQENSAPTIVACVHRLRDEVFWQPAFTLEAGLNETIRWWTSTRFQR